MIREYFLGQREPMFDLMAWNAESDATEFTFVLTSGGHNVGIINEPGHPRRSFRLTSWQEGDRTPDTESWMAATAPRQGSWWPAW